MKCRKSFFKLDLYNEQPNITRPSKYHKLSNVNIIIVSNDVLDSRHQTVYTTEQ